MNGMHPKTGEKWSSYILLRSGVCWAISLLDRAHISKLQITNGEDIRNAIVKASALVSRARAFGILWADLAASETTALRLNAMNALLRVLRSSRCLEEHRFVVTD